MALIIFLEHMLAPLNNFCILHQRGKLHAIILGQPHVPAILTYRRVHGEVSSEKIKNTKWGQNGEGTYSTITMIFLHNSVPILLIVQMRYYTEKIIQGIIPVIKMLPSEGFYY